MLSLRSVVIVRYSSSVATRGQYGIPTRQTQQWPRPSVGGLLLVALLCRLGMHQSQPICFSIALFPEAFVVPGWGPSADL